MDVLFQKLKQSKLGCPIGNIFFGCLGYADDCTLLAPSITSTNLMLTIVSEYGKEYNVKFNASKTQLVLYGSKEYNDNIVFQGTILHQADGANHLGNCLGDNYNEDMIDKTISSFLVNFNYIMSCFNFCAYDVKYCLFKTYCMSLYGSVLWDMSGKYIEKFFVVWRKCMRKLLNLDYKSRSKYLPFIVNDIPVDAQLHRRFLKFFYSTINSDNVCLQMCSKLILLGSQSNACKNINYIWHKYQINESRLDVRVPNTLSVYFEHDMFESQLNSFESVAICNIKDLMYMDNDIFSKCEIKEMIDYFCTN